MQGGYFYIEDADEFAFSFESPNHFKTWLLEAHIMYEFEEVEELKQLFVDNDLLEYYLILKEFEQKYLL